MARHKFVVSLFALALVVGACGKARKNAEPLSTSAERCIACHGGQDNASGAPPHGLRGETDTSARAVGAHTLHVSGTRGVAVACAECHLDPRGDPSKHLDGKVEVVFGALATKDGAAPAWDGAGCAASYCHGKFTGGKPTNVPSWTAPRANACGSCHGLPPPKPHPASTDCGKCHPGYTSTSVNAATHVNGTVDVAGLTCTSCHGDPARAVTATNPQLPVAPPKGTGDETSTTERAVGAHQKHLVAGPLTAGLPCTECHTLPTSVIHPNGQVELVWGPIAKAGGATPAWDGAGCSASYCHGKFTGGNAGYVPAWTAAKANPCGTCHGVPPPPPHVQNPDCGKCHPGYTATSVDPAKHVNGVVDYGGLACTSCHGDADRAATAQNPQLPAAPPSGTAGETATTARAVGAHQRHLGASATSGGVACTECHAVPTSMLHATGDVELAWGPLAKTGGVAPAWNGSGCSASYCHGSFKGGNAAYAPAWTAPKADACGSCHGNPSATPSALPLGSHAKLAPGSTNATCAVCHADTVDAGGAIVLAGGKHVNGTVDTDPAAKHPLGWLDPASADFHGKAAALGARGCFRCHTATEPAKVTTWTCALCHSGPGGTMSCNICHGSANNAAPPKDTGGATATTAVGVGAHQSHVTASHGISSPLDCVFCHDKPASLLDGTHLDGVADVTGYTGADPNLLAKLGAPGWDATPATCATAYCHGATLVGGDKTKPVWTQVDGSQIGCTACHGAPPATGRPAGPVGSGYTVHTFHVAYSYPCGVCHPGYLSGGVNAATHVNGTVEVGNRVTSWDPVTGTCVGCHALCSATGFGGPKTIPCVWR